MRTLRTMCLCLFILCCLNQLFAQTDNSANANTGDKSPSGISQGHESEYFCQTVHIEKVYPHRRGYVILYRQGVNKINRGYIPIEWFSGPEGKADLIQIGSGQNWPHVSVYYKSGEFSHLRLYVRRERNHQTWGNIPSASNLDQYFDNVTELKLEF